MTTSLLLPVLGASVVGSLHCAGMCGPLVAVAVGRGGWRAHLAYHLARGVAYVTLGACAGAAGALLDLAGALGGLRSIAGALAGVVLLLVGLSVLGRELPRLSSRASGEGLFARAFGAWREHVRVPARWTRSLRALQRRAAGLPPVLRSGGLGATSALLPCGWLYAFVLSAAGTSSAWTGALILAAFWAGTIPVLAGMGGGAAWLRRRTPGALSAATGLILVGLGAWSLAGRVELVPSVLMERVEVQGAEHGPVPGDAAPACCDGGGT